MPIKWQPFKDQLNPFQMPPMPDEFSGGGDDGFGWVPFLPSSRANEPAVDIYQDKDNLYVEIALGGGIKPEDIEVSVKENFLVIEGKTEEKQEVKIKEKTKEKDYLRREIKRGTLKRVIKLPTEVKKNKVIAESHNGILKITLPKLGKNISGAKKIPIQIK